MKRFFCSTCQREVRVRRLPVNVDSQIVKVTDRIGTCRHHDQPKSRATINDRAQVHHVFSPKKSLSAVQARSKSKKG